ncbi:hypothetical protein [Rhizobium leguminosarum]|uniref:hypothetical protein n=1 Tax=Rhizobium leguminosarum TaxID=384 RepID=UPI001440F2C8|nr:hypothetical protein [Rhizobium leguminosarum]NKL66280.1 hypothetical protein [Rhizobium leguminosarum bv. viciae]
MSKAAVRSVVGLGLILGHITAFLLIFYRLDSYTPSLESKLGLVLSIAPITGAFALAATRHIISSQSKSTEKGRYDPFFSFLAITLPLGFVSLIILELSLYPNGISKSLESLRLSLGIMETGVGLVVGAFVGELFGVQIQSIKEEIVGQSQSKPPIA